MAETQSKPPVGRLGRVVESSAFGGDSSWSSFQRHLEETPELKWPSLIRNTRLMMNDSQIAALYAMTTLQIRGYKWFVDPNGCDDAIVERVGRNLGLPIKGDDGTVKRRSTHGFKFKRHVYHVLKAMIPGHAYFELEGIVADDGFWDLKRLGFLPPESIIDFDVPEDGELRAIKQRGKTFQNVVLPRNRLAVYRWDAEDGDWIGRSALRSCYADFLLKDVVKRVNVINLERGGGMPWMEADADASGPQMQAYAEVAQDWKVHENAGVSVPAGSKLHIEKASAPDAIATLRYHDESMAKAWLAMFAQLGQHGGSGSYALGSTFVDFFALGQRAIADDLIIDSFNDDVIEPMVTWNYGEQESLPLLAYEVPQDVLPVADLIALVNAGIITVDDEVSEWLSQAYNLPTTQAKVPEPKPASEPPVVIPDEPPAEASAKKRWWQRKAATDDWPFRRQLNSVEAAAGLDPVRIENDHEDALSELLAIYQDEIKPAVVADLGKQIRDAGGDVTEIAKISATIDGAKFKAPIKKTFEAGHASHVAEAAAQGVTIGEEEADDADADDRAVALGGLLAVGIGVAAMQKALSLTGSGSTADSVADQVEAFLGDLKDAPAGKSLRGAVTRSYNGGRFTAMKTGLAQKDGTISSSELLDANTCGPCSEVDGKEYDSLEAGEEDYPAGGYAECEGDDYCRGTLIVEYKG